MSEPAQSRRPTFRPRFTLGIFYLLGVFFLYAMLLVMPEMIQALKTIPPGPEQQEAVTNMLQANMRPRLGIALVAAIATVLGGAVKGCLPGLRPQT
ncbi:MAG: hypothetical protein E2P06_04070 [Acidobacteria bacterium]|nr:MAG: hypothetical protein E2P06_04070 [Acidobacteriota bacterium]